MPESIFKHALQLVQQVACAAWRILTFTRAALANILLVLAVGLFVGFGLFEHVPKIPDKSVLVIDLAGNIVEQGSISGDTITALVRGSEPETRLHDVLRALTLAKTDDRIGAIMMHIDDLQGAGLATLREIGVAMDRFKQSGKRIVVWSTSFSQKQYAVAAHASAVYMHPMGQVLLKGLASQRMYWGDALKKLGVTVHVFKAGDFKSAPEVFVRNAPSPEALQADQFWIADAWKQWTDEIESARGLMPGAITRLIDDLPARLKKADGDLSRLALNENLIDGIYTSDAVRGMLLEGDEAKGTDDPPMVDYLTYLAAHPTVDHDQKAVAVITIEGEIKDGVDTVGMTGERTLVERIRAVRHADDVGALVVRIDSPGGSAVASELIRRELELVRQAGKPVVASFGDYAASGGYWVALAADKIVTDPQSITGSIGVFGMMPTFEKTLEQLSIGVGGVSTTWLANAQSMALPMPPEYEKIMQLTVAHTYRNFLNLVAQGRNLKPEQVAKLAHGRVYTGRQALEKGLADQLGGLEEAIALAADLSGASPDNVWRLDPKQGRLGMIIEHFFLKMIDSQSRAQILLQALTPSLDAGARLLQLVQAPNSTYAHCLCSAP